ncbi:MAG: DUF421 domain-containing protein [Clostridiales bacterium]|nr:DUF421 domain-containing protein [Clostridiales bacterium]
MNIYLEVVLRTLFTIAILLVLTKIDGAKQISQLSFFDYIIGITAGSVAAVMCVDQDVSIWASTVALVLFMLSGALFSYLSQKSIFCRRILEGNPVFIIAKGEILYKGLKKARFSINDLMRELRSQGYFDITEINYAILETNGNVSVMPKALARPATNEDEGNSVQDDSVRADVVIDGKILHGNLKAFGKNEQWLATTLQTQGIAHLKDVALASLDTDDNLSVYKKNNMPVNRTVFQ